MTEHRDGIRVWIVASAVAALTVVVFSPAVGGPWIFDDHALVADNPHVHSFASWRHWFASDFFDVSEQVVKYQSRIMYWRPAVSASLALDWQLGGGSPVVFHVMNLFYQAIVALLAFSVLRRWIGGAVLPAAAAALLFAVHPTKAESVAWVSGRTDVLCTIAVFAACEGFARRRAGHARSGLALEAVATALAYMCKEQAIVLPLFVAVEAWVADGRAAIDRRRLVRIVKAALPQAAVAVAYLAARAVWLPLQSAQPQHVSLALWDHLAIVLETLGRLFELTFAPHALSTQHGQIELDNGVMQHSTPHVVAGAVGVAMLLAAAIAARRRWPVATVAIVLYLGALLPTSNLKFSEMIPLVSERFLYLPMIAPALVVGSALTGRAAYALAIAVAVTFGALAASHSADFRDEKAFWARELRLHPSSKEALRFMYTNAAAEHRYDDALAYLAELQVVQQHVPMHGGDVLIGTEVASIASHMVPDHDTAALRAIDRFAGELLAHDDGAVATLDVRGIKLAIPTTKPGYAANLRVYETRLLALRADIAGRLADDALAIELVTQASAVCATCPDVVATAALAYARAGRYPEAREILARAAGKTADDAVTAIRERLDRGEQAQAAALGAAGPVALQARATELSTLGLFGRAYDVLAPYKADIEQAPGMVLGFAELAFRAGEPAVAREALAGRAADEVDGLLREWAKRMGWPPP